MSTLVLRTTLLLCIFSAAVSISRKGRAARKRGVNFAKEGQFDDAVAQFEVGLRTDTDDVKLWYNLGTTLRHKAHAVEESGGFDEIDDTRGILDEALGCLVEAEKSAYSEPLVGRASITMVRCAESVSTPPRSMMMPSASSDVL